MKAINKQDVRSNLIILMDNLNTVNILYILNKINYLQNKNDN